MPTGPLPQPATVPDFLIRDGKWDLPREWHSLPFLAVTDDAGLVDALRRMGYGTLGNLHGVAERDLADSPRFTAEMRRTLKRSLYAHVRRLKPTSVAQIPGLSADMRIRLDPSMHGVLIRDVLKWPGQIDAFAARGITTVGDLDGHLVSTIRRLPHIGVEWRNIWAKIHPMNPANRLDPADFPVPGDIPVARLQPAPPSGPIPPENPKPVAAPVTTTSEPTAPTFTSALAVVRHLSREVHHGDPGGHLLQLALQHLGENQPLDAAARAAGITGKAAQNLLDRLRHQCNDAPWFQSTHKALKALSGAYILAVVPARKALGQLLGWLASDPMPDREAAAVCVLFACSTGARIVSGGHHPLIVHDMRQGGQALAIAGALGHLDSLFTVEQKLGFAGLRPGRPEACQALCESVWTLGRVETPKHLQNLRQALDTDPILSMAPPTGGQPDMTLVAPTPAPAELSRPSEPPAPAKKAVSRKQAKEDAKKIRIHPSRLSIPIDVVITQTTDLLTCKQVGIEFLSDLNGRTVEETLTLTGLSRSVWETMWRSIEKNHPGNRLEVAYGTRLLSTTERSLKPASPAAAPDPAPDPPTLGEDLEPDLPPTGPCTLLHQWCSAAVPPDQVPVMYRIVMARYREQQDDATIASAVRLQPGDVRRHLRNFVTTVQNTPLVRPWTAAFEAIERLPLIDLECAYELLVRPLDWPAKPKGDDLSALAAILYARTGAVTFWGGGRGMAIHDWDTSASVVLAMKRTPALNIANELLVRGWMPSDSSSLAQALTQSVVAMFSAAISDRLLSFLGKGKPQEPAMEAEADAERASPTIQEPTEETPGNESFPIEAGEPDDRIAPAEDDKPQTSVSNAGDPNSTVSPAEAVPTTGNDAVPSIPADSAVDDYDGNGSPAPAETAIPIQAPQPVESLPITEQAPITAPVLVGQHLSLVLGPTWRIPSAWRPWPASQVLENPTVVRAMKLSGLPTLGHLDGLGIERIAELPSFSWYLATLLQDELRRLEERAWRHELAVHHDRLANLDQEDDLPGPSLEGPHLLIPTTIRNRPLQHIVQSLETFDALERAGLRTLGDLHGLHVAKLTGVDGLDTERWRALMEDLARCTPDRTEPSRIFSAPDAQANASSPTGLLHLIGNESAKSARCVEMLLSRHLFRKTWQEIADAQDLSVDRIQQILERFREHVTPHPLLQQVALATAPLSALPMILPELAYQHVAPAMAWTSALDPIETSALAVVMHLACDAGIRWVHGRCVLVAADHQADDWLTQLGTASPEDRPELATQLVDAWDPSLVGPQLATALQETMDALVGLKATAEPGEASETTPTPADDLATEVDDLTVPNLDNPSPSGSKLAPETLRAPAASTVTETTVKVDDDDVEGDDAPEAVLHPAGAPSASIAPLSPAVVSAIPSGPPAEPEVVTTGKTYYRRTAAAYELDRHIRQVLTEAGVESLHYTRICELVRKLIHHKYAEPTIYQAILTAPYLSRVSLGRYALTSRLSGNRQTQAVMRRLPEWQFQPWEKGVRLHLPAQRITSPSHRFAWRIQSSDGSVEEKGARPIGNETLSQDFWVTAPGEWEVSFCEDDTIIWREYVSLPGDQPLLFGAHGGLTTQDSGDLHILLPDEWQLQGDSAADEMGRLGPWRIVTATHSSTQPLRFLSPDGDAWDGLAEVLTLIAPVSHTFWQNISPVDGIPTWFQWPQAVVKSGWQGQLTLHRPDGTSKRVPPSEVQSLFSGAKTPGRYRLEAWQDHALITALQFRLWPEMQVVHSVSDVRAWAITPGPGLQISDVDGCDRRVLDGNRYDLTLHSHRLSAAFSVTLPSGESLRLQLSPPQLSWRLAESDTWGRKRLTITSQTLETGTMWLDLRASKGAAVLILHNDNGEPVHYFFVQSGARRPYRLHQLLTNKAVQEIADGELWLHVDGHKEQIATLKQYWHPQSPSASVDDQGNTIRSVIAWESPPAPSEAELYLLSASRPWEPPQVVQVPDGATSVELPVTLWSGFLTIVATHSETDPLDFFGSGETRHWGSAQTIEVRGLDAELLAAGSDWMADASAACERWWQNHSRRSMVQMPVPTDERDVERLLKAVRTLSSQPRMDAGFVRFVATALAQVNPLAVLPILESEGQPLPLDLIPWLGIPQWPTEAIDRIEDWLPDPVPLLLDSDEATWDKEAWQTMWAPSLLASGTPKVVDTGSHLAVATLRFFDRISQDALTHYVLKQWLKHALNRLDAKLARCEAIAPIQLWGMPSNQWKHDTAWCIHALAYLQRRIGTEHLDVDPELIHLTAGVQELLPDVLWLAMGYWEVQGT